MRMPGVPSRYARLKDAISEKLYRTREKKYLRNEGYLLLFEVAIDMT